MAYPPLLPWYEANKRALPFRGTRDPYAVWISEIMLQQTRTETVAGYYSRFLARFPDVCALAAASEQEVLKHWEGLGYYSRARNLHKAARIVRDEYGGQFPRSYEAVRALSGVGDYTAAAICSIAYRMPCPAIDGNLTRVISRLHDIREDVGMPSTQRRIRQLALENIDRESPGDWNQALMDLGATVCLPGTPDCAACPLRSLCRACAEGDPETLPLRAASKPPLPVDVGVGLVTCGGHILVQQREAALLRGLWVFVLCEGNNTPEAMEKKLKGLRLNARFIADLGECKHVFTHRIWNMKLYHFTAQNAVSIKGGQWVDADALSSLPLPTAMKKARQAARSLLRQE
ncbi:MAG: A/G-specific adenine glycosylase [Clostridia bacterium]|nr:A/G-specific adenine glycosylase [Clostridia bacterium]